MLRILMADDHLLFIQPLAQQLHKNPDLDIVDLVTHPQQIWDRLQQTQIDLLLLDLKIGHDIRDLTLAKQIQQQYPGLKIVILTGAIENIRLIHEANKMRLTGFLSKVISEEQLVLELKKVEEGKRVFSPEVLDILLSDKLDELPELTRQEATIISLLLLGMKREAICLEMEFKAKSTYDTHVQNLKRKFGVSSTNELLRKAAELGYA